MEWSRLTSELTFKSGVYQIIILEAIACWKYGMLGLAPMVYDFLDIITLMPGMTLLMISESLIRFQLFNEIS